MKKFYISVLLTLLALNINGQNYDGIDVSHYQGNIDWKEVSKDASIKFVYIKATEGSTYIDPKFDNNIMGAIKQGLNVGVYHYFSTKSSPEKQFKHFKSVVSKYKFTLVPMLDIEISLSKDYNKTTAIRNIRKFMSLVKKEFGVYPIIYGTQRSYNTVCSPHLNNYILYIGRYGKNEPQIITTTGLRHKYSIWQFSESGKISGINKPVDLCKFNKDTSLSDITL